MKKTSHGPSQEELRLRSELDQARRELRKLKDTKDTKDTKDAKDAKDAGAGPPADDVAALRAQVTELDRTRQRLSKLYFGQVEEAKKRAEKVRRVLDVAARLAAESDLEAILGATAAAIPASFGFATAVVHLRDPGATRFRARAFAGVAELVRVRLESDEVTLDTVAGWTREEYRLGRSYLVRPGDTGTPRGAAPAPHDWTWEEGDALLVPLHGRDGDAGALLWLEHPADRQVPAGEMLELLEWFGAHAFAAMENARRQNDLRRRGREAEEAGQRLQDIHVLRSNFVAAVSHELRTPLTAIRAYVDTLLGIQEGQLNHGQLLHFLSIIGEESERLARLVESVLDLNRFDSGTARVTRKRVDLAALCDDTIHQLWPMAEAAKVSLKEVNETADTLVDADRDQLRQLLLHLGSNAIKFTAPGGTVTFRIAGDEQEIRLQVEDTGIGIPEEALDRVFERFYQVDASPTRRFGGTGLGLAICKSIVEGHGGRIGATSTVGQGSCFAATLPRRTPVRVVVRPDAARTAGVEDVLRLGIEMVADIMNARVVSLLAPGRESDLRVEAAIGLEEHVVRDARVQIGSGVAGWVAEHRRPVCVARRDAQDDVEASGHAHYQSGTFLSVPLEGENGLLGVLNVTDPNSDSPFRAEDCYLLLHLAGRVAAAWAQASRPGKGAVAADAARSLRSLRAPEVPGRRAQLARAVAREMELGEAEIGAISFAASLQAEESSPSSEAPQGTEALGLVHEIAISHREWWDGSGFPRALSGTEIPVGGRILAVVDAWLQRMENAETPESAPAALAAIRDLAGQQFDPDVVRVLERVALTTAPRPKPSRSERTETIATQGGE